VKVRPRPLGVSGVSGVTQNVPRGHPVSVPETPSVGVPGSAAAVIRSRVVVVEVRIVVEVAVAPPKEQGVPLGASRPAVRHPVHRPVNRRQYWRPAGTEEVLPSMGVPFPRITEATGKADGVRRQREYNGCDVRFAPGASSRGCPAAGRARRRTDGRARQNGEPHRARRSRSSPRASQPNCAPGQGVLFVGALGGGGGAGDAGAAGAAGEAGLEKSTVGACCDPGADSKYVFAFAPITFAVNTCGKVRM